MARGKKTEWKYEVEYGPELTEQEIEDIAELLAQMVINQMQRDLSKSAIPTAQEDKESAQT